MTSENSDKGDETVSPKKVWERSIVAFGLGVGVAAIVGTIGALTWLERFVDRRIEVAEFNDVFTQDELERLARTIVTQHRDELRGEQGESVEASSVAAFLMANHRDELSGEDGNSPSAASVAAVLAQSHAAQIKGNPGDPAAFPSGAVVIFDRPSGCPTDWQDMGAQWKGHVAVAAVRNTNDTYGFGRSGGSEAHTLTVAEMPNHDHSFTGNSITRGGWGGTANRDVAVGGSQVVSDIAASGKIGSSGGGQAHNNMPPYIALYFCKK